MVINRRRPWTFETLEALQVRNLRVVVESETGKVPPFQRPPVTSFTQRKRQWFVTSRAPRKISRIMLKRDPVITSLCICFKIKMSLWRLFTKSFILSFQPMENIGATIFGRPIH